MRFVAKLLAGLVLVLLAGAVPAQAQDALLVIAHGARQAEWNNRVLRLVEKVNWPGPVGVAFLMSAPEGHGLDEVVQKLDNSGAARIVVLPLMVSSYGEHYEEIRYYVGDRKERPEHAHHAPFQTKARLILTPAMDEHEVISGILTEQARAMSRDTASESLVLVAHGPTDEEFNHQWLAKLGHHAERVRRSLEGQEYRLKLRPVFNLFANEVQCRHLQPSLLGVKQKLFWIRVRSREAVGCSLLTIREGLSDGLDVGGFVFVKSVAEVTANHAFQGVQEHRLFGFVPGSVAHEDLDDHVFRDAAR